MSRTFEAPRLNRRTRTVLALVFAGVGMMLPEYGRVWILLRGMSALIAALILIFYRTSDEPTVTDQRQ